MDELHLRSRIEVAHKLADLASTPILHYYRFGPIPYWEKEDVSSIVTIADTEAEKVMRDHLAKTIPKDGIIGEELENVPSSSGYSWVLDPIDGTSSFVAGLPIFGTLIACIEVENETPLLGILHQPILNERFVGIKGETSTFNGEKIKNVYQDRTDLSLINVQVRSTTPRMFTNDFEREIAQKFQRVCKKSAFGGDCYNYGMMALGKSTMPIIVLEADLKSYDFYPLIPIIEGAGGVITDWEGKKLSTSSTRVLAAPNKKLSDEALKLINT